MKNKILSYLLGWLLVLPIRLIIPYVYAQDCDCPPEDLGCQKACYYESQEYEEKNTPEKKCNGIKLNTNFPIIWNCIWTSKDSKTNPTTAFPKMVWALTKIIMSLILVVCFIFIIVAGIMWAWSWEDNSQVTKAKWILKKVAIVILLLWFSWAILRLINPNFFG
jgi:hypothetical protein